MVTSLELNFDVGEQQHGYIKGNHKLVTAGTSIPIYIPKIMSNIERDYHAKESIDNPSSIFINDKDCRPKVKKIISSTNILHAKLTSNFRKRNLPDMTISVNRTFRKYLTTVDLSDGEKVECEFHNQSVKSIEFNVNATD